MAQAGPGIRDQLRAKLKEWAGAPRVPKVALRGMRDCYKIKLRQSGCRLVYRVEEGVMVIAIGRRDGGRGLRRRQGPALGLATRRRPVYLAISGQGSDSAPGPVLSETEGRARSKDQPR